MSAHHQEDPGGVRRLPNVTPAGGELDSGGELDQAITVLRARVEEEFSIAERLDSKSRQAFALAAGFFAVIQTVAFGSFAQAEISTAERVVMLILVVVSGALVAWVAYVASQAEDLQDESDIQPASIVQWANEAGADPEYVRARLVRGLADVAQARADNNKVRATRYDAVVTAVKWALVAAGVELIVAIVARL